MPKLSKNDRLAYNIGKITLKYNDVQFWFFLIFRSLMHEALYLAHPTFFALKSDRGQRDMVRFLAKERLKEHSALLKDLEAFIERANQLGGRRNDALHAMWDYDLPRKTPTVRLPLHNRLVGKNAEDSMLTLLSDLETLENEIFPFYKNVKDTLRAESAEKARRSVAEAFARGLRPPDQGPAAKAVSPRSGRKGSPPKRA